MNIFEHILVAWEPVGLQFNFMKDDNFTIFIIIIIVNHNRLLHLHVIPQRLININGIDCLPTKYDGHRFIPIIHFL